LILLVGLIVTLPVATGILADPTWKAGIYDGADLDDLIASTEVGAGNLGPDLLPPSRSPEWPPSEQAVSGPPRDLAARQSRAPPTS
jgi:hypothetical protein